MGPRVIHGCYKKSGALRVIDTDAPKPKDAACGKSETALDWNATGPTGPAGPTFRAAVDSNGTLKGGSATNAVRDSTGTYTVTFASGVGNCVGVAEPGVWHDGSSSSGPKGTVIVPSSATP